jgi:hypothetical protein
VKTPPASAPAPATNPGLTEVRYSLPDLLREIAQERTSQTFAMEKLEQAEIGKLFSQPRKRRALKSRQ